MPPVSFSPTTQTPGTNTVLPVPKGHFMQNHSLTSPRHDHRRLDLVIGIGYDEDIRQAKAILTEIVTSDSRVLAEPAPRVAVNNLGESSIELMVRPFVRTANFDATRADLLEQIKLRFDEAGITPNPQRAVRLVQAAE